MAGTNHATSSEYLDEYRRLIQSIDPTRIDEITEVLFSAWKADKCVFLLGNGGSALTASHWALDLMKTASVPRSRRLKAISLCDNFGVTTAVGNDASFDEIFSYPLETYGQAGDIVVAISCSGNSPNVLLASQWAIDHQLVLITLTGFEGGKLQSMGRFNFHIPSSNYGVIEDFHMSIGHMVAQGFKAHLETQMSG